MLLHLRVLEATDIAQMDANKSDPYCVIRLSSSDETRKTRVIKNTLTPKWNEEFHFTVQNQATCSLVIKMIDQDILVDDPMSTLEINLASLQVGQVLDQWYEMRPCPRVRKGGRIHLITHLAPVGVQPFQQMQPPMGQPGYPPQPPMGQPGYPPQPPMGQPGYPSQPPMGQPGYPPMAQPGYPPMGQPGYPPMAQPGYPQQPVMAQPVYVQPGYGYPPRPPGMSDHDYKKMCKPYKKAMKKAMKGK